MSESDDLAAAFAAVAEVEVASTRQGALRGTIKAPRGQDTAIPSERPWLTLTQVAKATGLHRNTVRGYLDERRFPHARQIEQPEGRDRPLGTWLVSVDDVLAAGLTLQAPTPP